MSHHDEHESHLARNLVIAGGAYLAGVALSNHMHRHPRRWVTLAIILGMIMPLALLAPDQNKKQNEEIFANSVSSCSEGFSNREAYCVCSHRFVLKHTTEQEQLAGVSEEVIDAAGKACERLWPNN